MRTQISCFVTAAGMLAIGACSDTAPSPPAYTTGSPSTTTAGTPTGAGGSGGSNTTNMTAGAAGTVMPTTTGMAGSEVTSGGGSGGNGGSGGSSAGSAGTAGSSGSAGAAGQPMGDGGPGGGAITSVRPTAGCGKPPGPAGAGTIATMGTKPAGCADSKCGPWMYTRQYIVTLPAGYMNSKAYPLVFEGPGCGGTAADVYPLNDGTAANVGNTVIRVGLTPPPNAIGHATNPNQGCFDDKEGDDSVDWVFYENLWDKLAGQFCFDQNRVFSVGNSSGSWFSNEVGCKYAGDPVHPIRGVMPNTGGLPDQPQYKPTCTTNPMAGMWVHEVGDTTNPFTGNQYAITRAMGVNKCPGGSYAGATWVDYPIGGGNAPGTCKKMVGCPEIYPLVACPLPGNAHGSHDNVTNPGFSTFIKEFSKGAFITQ